MGIYPINQTEYMNVSYSMKLKLVYQNEENNATIVGWEVKNVSEYQMSIQLFFNNSLQIS